MDTIPTQADDAALLRAFSERGDRQAMNVLFARHADAAYRVALRCCRNAADAEDAVQTAFIEVLRHSAKYRGESAVKAWIFGFVVNACRHKAREEGRRAAREERASVSGELASDDRDNYRAGVQPLVWVSPSPLISRKTQRVHIRGRPKFVLWKFFRSYTTISVPYQDTRPHIFASGD